MTTTRGRPQKPEEEKVLKNGLFPRQWERIKTEANVRGVLSAAQLLRQIVDWYFSALDKHQTTVSIASEQDDNQFEELTKE